MTNEVFGDWVKAHVIATGADPERVTELLWANRDTIVGKWEATYAELCECSQRLIEQGKVPEYPAGHTNAIKVELDALRRETKRPVRDQAFLERYRAVGHVPGCDCPDCNGGEVLPSYDQAKKLLEKYVEAFKGKKGRKQKGKR